MHPHRDSKRKALNGPLLLLAPAIVAVALSLAGEALAVDRWKHPPARAGAGQFRALRVGPNAHGPSAVEPNARAAAIANPDQRRETVGGAPAEGRPPELERPALNPAERGAPQRPFASPTGRNAFGPKRRPHCKRNLTISEAFGCSHVSGL
jgi:hypothetical protein